MRFKALRVSPLALKADVGWGYFQISRLSFICVVGEIRKKISKIFPKLCACISATKCVISSILWRRSLRENKQIHYIIVVFMVKKSTVPFHIRRLHC